MIQLDRIRAAGVQKISASTTTTGQENLIVDLTPPHLPGYHYIVEQASLIAGLVTRGPSTAGGYPPATGLFLCPPGTPGESLAEAQAGIVLAARPILIPLGPPGANVNTVGAGTFAFSYALTSAPGFKCTLPYGWFIRAIVACLQGTATPGPGTGSQGILSVLCYQEKDNDVNPADCL